MSRFSDYIDTTYKDSITNIQRQRDRAVDALGGGNELKFPNMSSGSRSYIQVAGKPLALCMDFNYQITAETEEIRTIDTNLPWDVSIGQIRISATLRKFVHPDTSFEKEGLFHTMQSFIHQPFIEILVQDVNGNAQFYTKGMFTSVQGQFSRGNLTVRSANFVGVAYQHWVFQEFTPYPEQNELTKINKKLKQIQNKIRGFGVGL